MSETIKVIQDPRVDFEKKKSLVQEVGGHLVNYQSLPFTPVSLGSNANASTQVSNGLGFVTKPYFHVVGTWSANCTQVSAGNVSTSAIQFGGFGVSSNAFYKLITSINLNIGGQTNTWSNVNNTIDLIMNQRRSLYVDHSYYSRSALLPDNTISFHQLYLTNKNVLGAYYNNGFSHGIEPRSNILSVVTNPAVSGGVAIPTGTFEMYVPYVQSPMFQSIRDHECFIRAGTIQIQMNLVSDARNFFKCDPTYTTINSATMAFTTFELLYETIDLKGMNVDLGLQEYRAWKWDYNAQTITQTITAGTTASINVSQLQWSVQPELIMCCFRPLFSTQSVNCGQPAYYFPISGANITYINSNALAVPAGRFKEMYNITLRNGGNCDFATYCAQDVSGGLLSATTSPLIASPVVLSGYPLILNPVLDLNIGEDVKLSAGVNVPQQLQFDGNFYVYNQTAADVSTFEFICLRLVPQLYREVSEGNYQQVDISLDAPIEYIRDPSMNEMLRASDVSGAGFKDFLARSAKSIGKYALGKIVDNLPALESKLASFAGKLIPGSEGLISEGFKLANPALRALVSGKGIDESSVMEMIGRGITEEQILMAHPHLNKIKSGNLPTEKECLELIQHGMSEEQILNMINLYQKEAGSIKENKRDRILNKYK